MPIVPFNIVNQDGSINQSEYERCINFLNDYTNGLVKIYPEVTWANPVEIDMERDESALEILSRYILYSDNKLLNNKAYRDIRRLFHGILERYGSTIHSYGKYLEASENFTDGPGYMYDVFLPSEKPVKVSHLNSDIDIYYLDDDNHTVLEYNDRAYSAKNIDNIPITNIPIKNRDNTVIVSNVNTYPDVYKGNLCGVYSDFQRLSGQYVGSSTLFYYSMCKDQLFETGLNSYNDNRLHEIINFNYRAKSSNKSIPVQGINLDKVSAAQKNVVNIEAPNAYIKPSLINTEVNYLSPTFFTAANEDEWINIDET